jgi:fructose/tagatose bisphosphate aldolase
MACWKAWSKGNQEAPEHRENCPDQEGSWSLTLHGGSGTDDEDFLRAIAAGINIIHINTELQVAWRRSLEGSLTSQRNEVVPYKILPPVVESVKQVVTRLKLFTAQLTSNEMHLSTGR